MEMGEGFDGKACSRELPGMSVSLLQRIWMSSRRILTTRRGLTWQWW